MLLSIRSNFVRVVADEQNVMDTCMKHTRKCCCAVIQKSGNVQ